MGPTRLIKNEFYYQIQELEEKGASVHEIRELLGRGRARKGIFEGNLVDGELEIGQVASAITSILSAEQVIEAMINEFNEIAEAMCRIEF